MVKDGGVQSCECLEWHKRILCRHMLLVAWTLTERQVAKGNKQEFAGKVRPRAGPHTLPSGVHTSALHVGLASLVLPNVADRSAVLANKVGGQQPRARRRRVGSGSLPAGLHHARRCSPGQRARGSPGCQGSCLRWRWLRSRWWWLRSRWWWLRSRWWWLRSRWWCSEAPNQLHCVAGVGSTSVLSNRGPRTLFRCNVVLCCAVQCGVVSYVCVCLCVCGVCVWVRVCVLSCS